MAVTTYTTATASRTKVQQCNHCDTHYAYTLEVVGVDAHTDSLGDLFTTRRKIEARSEAAARNRARRTLRIGSAPVRCPRCNRFNRAHARKLRKEKYALLRGIAWTTLIIAFVSCLYVAVGFLDPPPDEPLLANATMQLHLSILCVMLPLTLLIYGLQRWLTKTYNPDKRDRKCPTGQYVPPELAERAESMA